MEIKLLLHIQLYSFAGITYQLDNIPWPNSDMEVRFGIGFRNPVLPPYVQGWVGYTDDPKMACQVRVPYPHKVRSNAITEKWFYSSKPRFIINGNLAQTGGSSFTPRDTRCHKSREPGSNTAVVEGDKVARCKRHPIQSQRKADAAS